MLEKIKTTKDLSLYLGISEEKLKNINPETSYASFYIQKNGSKEKRLIEYPKGELFRILDRLCDGLQWLYIDHLTPAAYGFVRKIKPCSDPRDIYTNAKKHLGKKYLLNIDLDDFFHQIDCQKLKNLFSDYSLFSFDSQAECLMIKLVSYHGRLPMGSPTSPPLSNFATIGVDNDLLSWARRSNFTYTRFVDDLSFSSNMKITQTHLNQIIEILSTHRFVIGPNKTKFFGKNDQKEVTGLIIKERIQVPEAFISTFSNDLRMFRDMYQFVCQHPNTNVFEWLEQMRKVLYGRLAFLRMVQGENDETYKIFKAEIESMSNSTKIEKSISWRYAGYEYY